MGRKYFENTGKRILRRVFRPKEQDEKYFMMNKSTNYTHHILLG
jgi:hypothetical protein